MKGLRGHVLNPFAHHAEARMHRDLLAWYEAGLDRAADVARRGDSRAALVFLTAPDDIRGYGPVRMQAAATARRKAEAALSRIRPEPDGPERQRRNPPVRPA